jgi:CHAT domain-containing protein
MFSRIWMPLIGVLGLVACEPQSKIPNGSVVFEDEVALVRDRSTDVASREITLDSDAIVVAIVDEKLTDVRLKLAASGSAAKPIKPVEVENHQGGAGIEIAALRVPRGSRVTVTLSGPQTSLQPGSVRLRLRQFMPGSEREPPFAKLLSGYEAWTSATGTALAVDGLRSTALSALDRAITDLGSPQGDARLAAEARLLKANTMRRLQLDTLEARAEAQRAARAFEALGESKMGDAARLQVARARLVEAQALAAMALNREARDPTPEEASRDARRMLGELAAPDSAFGPIERSRVLRTLGRMEIGAAQVEEAKKQFTAAGALCRDAGYTEGERVMRVDLATSLVEQGRFGEARQAFAALVPELDRIADPESRVTVMIYAGRANSSTGRSDEAVDFLVAAVNETRNEGLRELESNALQELGYVYQNRGDMQQARGLHDQALKIMRDIPESLQLAYALEGAGATARAAGDYDAAIAMHQEAVARSSHPVQRVREMRSLALDYVAVGNYAEAEKQLRGALAIQLEDPRHHAYSDVKRNLAEVLIEHREPSRAERVEAQRLLDEALKRCDEVGDTIAAIGAMRGFAVLRTREGRTAEALAAYERTFERIFEYRRLSANMSLRPAAIGFEQSAFRGYFDLVMKDLVARGGGKPRRASAMEEHALRMLEAARELHFGTRPAPLDAAAAARADALLTQMGDKSLKIARLLRRELTPAETQQLESLQAEMANLRAQLDSERTAAAQKQGAGEHATLEAARPWLEVAPRTVQVSYALGNEHAYVWARDPRGTRVAVLSEPPEALERALTELTEIDPQKSPAQIEQALRNISPVLLPAELLAADSSSLEIVAEGRIASVPFAGLRSPLDPQRQLVETHAITMIPSLFARRAMPASGGTRPFRLVALASGGGTLRSMPVANTGPRLQAAIDEIHAIGELFEAQDEAARIKLLAGSDGSAAALRNIWSSGADVVHFATHALADLRQPLASLLVLPATDAQGLPTYLTAGQVQEWRGDAELVFLSACDSAIGPPRFAGGMPGLQTAFLRAGARGVIATLWPIEDVLAREFSADFYSRYTGGDSAQRALNDTQRSWLTPIRGMSEADQQRRRITALSHAYFTG